MASEPMQRAGTKTGDRSGLPVADEPSLRVLRETLAYARAREYTGWDYADGASSKIRQRIPIDSDWLNLLFQETAKRAPVNVRPLLRVERRRNYMGAALFAMANWNLHRLARDHLVRDLGPTDYRAETKDLLDWLLDRRRRGYSGFCGGHEHPIQQLDYLLPVEEPDVVDTSFAVSALLRGEPLDQAYADVARTAADFVREDLGYRPVDGGAVVDYHPNEPGDHYTLNAGALCARLLVDLYDRFGTDAYRERARALLDYVAAKQTHLGGWYYREPPSTSHLSMDNHHNGFIIASLLRYRAVTGSGRYDETIGRALRFYREVLFDADGAPNWDETDAYPRDVHASAVGIWVFTAAGDYPFARRVLRWTVDNLYEDGRFFFRNHRFYTKRITLMRWCQAWMAFAISEYLTAVAGGDE